MAITHDVIASVNAKRTKMGLKPLRADRRLTIAAQDHADYMASIKTMSHTGPEGSTLTGRVKKAGYTYTFVEEGIAAGHATAAALLAALTHSAADGQNMIDPRHEHIGVGHSPRGNYWSLILATSRGTREASLAGSSRLRRPPCALSFSRV
jgi:uncharacterized protein YkwD